MQSVTDIGRADLVQSSQGIIHIGDKRKARSLRAEMAVCGFEIPTRPGTTRVGVPVATLFRRGVVGIRSDRENRSPIRFTQRSDLRLRTQERIECTSMSESFFPPEKCITAFNIGRAHRVSGCSGTRIRTAIRAFPRDTIGAVCARYTEKIREQLGAAILCFGTGTTVQYIAGCRAGPFTDFHRADCLTCPRGTGAIAIAIGTFQPA